VGKPTGFIEFQREEAPERNPEERIHDWHEFSDPFNDDTVRNQGARCMDCGTPFCHVGIEIGKETCGCPINNLIPEWNDLVFKGNWKEALERLLLTNNFPEFTGRVCPAPCEGSCTLAISDSPVAIKNIERTIIDKGFENAWIKPRIPKIRTGKRVAIVGSGPAGLAAADMLNQRGHHVKVFERADRPGGLLMYGIPNMKLDKQIVLRRIRLLEKEGIEFILNTEVGRDVTATELNQQYDAVILCTGAQIQRDLNVEGLEGEGVYFAMDYLTGMTKGLLDSDFPSCPHINAEGKNVIVIGGGDTGADCVATAIRQNCKSVVQFSKHPVLPQKRESNNLWPTPPNIFTMDYAYEEAMNLFGKDPREYLIQTKKILRDEDGRVNGLITVEMEKIFTDERNYYFEELPCTEKLWPVDMIIIAIGFKGTDVALLEQFGVEHQGFRAKTNPNQYETSTKGVFVAGDVRRGQSLVVWAIREGREVAEKVDEFLQIESKRTAQGF